MLKATHQKTKTHNTHLVLKTIYQREELSRADIARETHLTRPTVSSIVADLIDSNFVVESGQGPSAGGKRPTLLAIAQDAHQLICLDLASREFRGGLVNLRGEISREISRPVEGRKDDEALELMFALIDRLHQQATAPILGIGIGTPGLINPRDGIVHQALNLGWNDLHLQELLAQRYRAPTYVANDSHLAALGEYTFGAFESSRNLIVIKIGQGVGAGMVINGQLLLGDGYGAGEIGHVVVAEDGPRCHCANRGCLDAIASTRAIVARGSQILNRPATWEAIMEAACGGHQEIQGLVRDAGKYLGVACAYLIGAFNIHHILLAGRISDFGGVILDEARRAAAGRALPSMAAETNIDFATLGRDIVILGSSAMILKNELGVV